MSGTKSYEYQREKDSGNRQQEMENIGRKMAGSKQTEREKLQSKTVKTCIHSEEKRENAPS